MFGGVPRRLAIVTFVHSTLSTFGDMNCILLNMLGPSLRQFFNQSLIANWGPRTDDEFESIFAATASLLFVGILVGFLTVGYCMERFGRRQTAVTLRACLGIAVSMLMIGAKMLNRFELYVVGHFLAGVANAYKIVLIIYMAECAPDQYRGLVSVALNTGAIVMLTAIIPLTLPNVLGTADLWPVLPAFSGVMAILHLIIGSQFPQSPKQLYIQYHDTLAASDAVEFYHGSKCDLNEIQEEFERERLQENHQAGIIEILKHHTFRYALFIVLLCAFVPVLSAINVKSQYLTTILGGLGMAPAEVTWALLVISLLTLPFGFLAPWIIECSGRRPLFISVALLCAVEWAGFGLGHFVSGGGKSPLGWMITCCGALIGQIASNLGLLVLAPIMTSELCPHNTRAAIAQFTQLLPIFLCSVEVFVFPSLLVKLGAFIYAILGLLCLGLAALLWLQLPETQGLSVDQIVRRLSHCRSRAATTQSLIRPNYGTVEDLSDDQHSSYHEI